MVSVMVVSAAEDSKDKRGIYHAYSKSIQSGLVPIFDRIYWTYLGYCTQETE